MRLRHFYFYVLSTPLYKSRQDKPSFDNQQPGFDAETNNFDGELIVK